MEPSADVIQKIFKRRRWAFKDQQSADMHVRRRPFLVQERRVGRTETVEVLLRH
jgi:hypothetical protein